MGNGQYALHAAFAMSDRRPGVVLFLSSPLYIQCEGVGASFDAAVSIAAYHLQALMCKPSNASPQRCTADMRAAAQAYNI